MHRVVREAERVLRDGGLPPPRYDFEPLLLCLVAAATAGVLILAVLILTGSV